MTTMSDPDVVAQQIAARVVEHYALCGDRITAPRLRDLAAQLTPLVDGALDPAAGDAQIREITTAVHDLLDILFRSPWARTRADIPASFWKEPGIGAVLAQVRAWLDMALVNYTTAARMLYADAGALSPAAAAARVRRLVERGDLVGHADPYEPNPQLARRVRRAAVTQLQRR